MSKNKVYLVSIVGYETFCPIILTSNKILTDKEFKDLCQGILEDVCKKAAAKEKWRKEWEAQEEYEKQQEDGLDFSKTENLPHMSWFFDKEEPNEVVANILCKKHGFKKPKIARFNIQEFTRVTKDGTIKIPK